MCLLTYQKQPIILSEDKIVYKVLDNGKAPYTHFKYELNKLYNTHIMKSDSSVPYDDEQRLFYKKDNGKLKDGVISIREGFHSFTNKEYIHTITQRYGINTWDIHECIIPAGSEYYEDETHLCVSNKIIIKDKIS